MVELLTHRFSGLGEALMSGIHACNPTTETFLSEEALKSLASHYKIQLKPEELLVAKSFINRRMEKETVPDTSTVFQLLDEDMFERSFSALRRLHTWLRNTMGQDRLNDLAIMSI